MIENRAESLNRFLQAYSQLAGLPPPRTQRLQLQPLIERVCRLETRLAIRLTPGPPVEIEGDPDQLQQALINLVKNAADAALSTVDLLEVEPILLTWHTAGADLILLIRDTGPGIANPGNLFVPFYTTKAGGTGIGLVLALQVLEAHHGTIRLRNRIDRPGCEAEVRLPCFPVHPAEIA